jgi:hypothetical protein
MDIWVKPATLLVAALVMSACSFSMEGLWPSLEGEDPAPMPQRVEIPPSPIESMDAPLIEPLTGSTPPSQDEVGSSARGLVNTTTTGTLVGQKVASLNAELQRLKGLIEVQNGKYRSLADNAAQASQHYHSLVGAINTRLHVGTTAGNPILVSQWQSAQGELDQIADDNSRLAALSNGVAANFDMANYLFESTRAAYSIQGAVEEDHTHLAVIEDNLSRIMVSNDRLINEINATISRHNNYLYSERHNLTRLALAVSNGRSYGPALSSGNGISVAPVAATRGGSETAARGGSALIVIRFDSANVVYEEALYGAVSTALEGKPDARFELVAVTPLSGAPSDVVANASNAKRDAERVMRSLIDMGLPADRVILASATSDTARTSEVQIYVR